VRALAVSLAALAGCAELGVISDGTSVSVGKPSRGYILDGIRLPDRGDGFFTREVWQTRDQRYGTEELIDLIVAVSRRLAPRIGGTRLVVADLSGRGGGAAHLWHRSHQSGRDVDLVYFMRDRDGKPMEADAMHVFDANGVARDGSGITVDIPKMWLLAKELATAPEAPVQWLFIYEPIAAKIVDYAVAAGEPEPLVAKVRSALKQPGDSARHDDHMHVRIYCSEADRMYGCLDFGPSELLEARELEIAALGATISNALSGGSAVSASASGLAPPAIGRGALGHSNFESLGRLLRARSRK
jgi:penicillin-insensitive murein DD-endopeptidase